MAFALILTISYVVVLYISPDVMNNNVLSVSWQLLTISVVFLIYFIAKYRKESVFCPELLFFIPFLFSTFLYSPFLYNEDINSYIFSFLLKETDANIIKSQSIATLGLLFYIFGGVVFSKIKNVKARNSVIAYRWNSIFISRKKPIHVLTTVIILFALFKGGGEIIYRYNRTDIGLTSVGKLFFYITILLVISSVIEFMSLNKKNVKTIKGIVKNASSVYLINISFMSGLFLLAGFRSALFPLILPVFYLYDKFIKRIKLVYLIGLIFFGLVFMSALKDTRSGNKSKASTNVFSLAYIGVDFISANQALFSLVENTDKQGSQKGENAIFQMVAFIPFAQSALISFFDIKTKPSSSVFFTEELESYWSGLGTHVIGDLYYGFGWFGVVFFMFALGSATSYLFRLLVQVSISKIWVYVLYLLILGNSIMFSRVEFFNFIRIMGFAVIILWIIKTWFIFNIQSKIQ